MEYSLFDTSLAFTSTWRWKQDMLFVRIWGAHQEKLDATLDIGQVTHPYAMTILQQNFDMQSSGKPVMEFHYAGPKCIQKHAGSLRSGLATSQIYQQ